MDNLISKYSAGDRVQGKSIVTNMSKGTIQNIVKGHRGFIYTVKWDDNSQTEVKEKDFWSDSSAVANSTSNYIENVLSSAGNVESDSDSEDSNDDSNDDNDADSESDTDEEETSADANFIGAVLTAATEIQTPSSNLAPEVIAPNPNATRARRRVRVRNGLRAPAVTENGTEPTTEVNLLCPNGQEWTQQANVKEQI